MNLEELQISLDEISNQIEAVARKHGLTTVYTQHNQFKMKNMIDLIRTIQQAAEENRLYKVNFSGGHLFANLKGDVADITLSAAA